jgi:hypothetical protein
MKNFSAAMGTTQNSAMAEARDWLKVVNETGTAREQRFILEALDALANPFF